MIIDYSAQKTFEQSLIIDDIGNFCIRCEGEVTIFKVKWQVEYYITAHTIMGQTSILKYGPVVPDFDTLLDGFNITFKSLKFNEAKIQKEIELFLNDGKKGITFAEQVDPDEFYKNMPPLVLPD